MRREKIKQGKTNRRQQKRERDETNNQRKEQKG